ncbi:Phage integrase family protein [Janthinobacterium lividum]|nr:Phage integrase family protein [Janthinobacterium lividum]
MATHNNVVEDLVNFKRFLDSKNIRYDNFDLEIHELPTYRYRNFLQKQFNCGSIPSSTGNRRLQSVVSFYRFLFEKKLIIAKTSPWTDKEFQLNLTNEKGFRTVKKIQTTDMRLRAKSQPDPWSGTIYDGGKLRPLEWAEQKALVSTLLKVGSPEMILVYLIAIFTGARIQTILTLQNSSFRPELVASSREIRIKVGPGTGVDTKGGKLLILIFPPWLYERITIYCQSERSQHRRMKLARDDESSCNVFLTKFGRPYYSTRKERAAFDEKCTTRYESNGQEVRKFKSVLVEAIRCNEKLPHLSFRFHDLRATFGMNLTDAQMALVETGVITLSEAREYVKFAMGHSSYETTDRYLSYRSNATFTRRVRDAYGDHLSTLSSLAKGSEL